MANRGGNGGGEHGSKNQQQEEIDMHISRHHDQIFVRFKDGAWLKSSTVTDLLLFEMLHELKTQSLLLRHIIMEDQ